MARVSDPDRPSAPQQPAQPHRPGPPQPWTQAPGQAPGHQPGQQPGGQPWGGPPGQQSWGGPPAGQQHWGAAPARPATGGLPLLVLALVTGVLVLAASVLPTYDYGTDIGSFSPLLQRFGDETVFQAPGLVFLLAAGVLVTGGLLSRVRSALGAGLVLLGAGAILQQGLGLLLALVQSLVSSDSSLQLRIGGVVLLLATACAGAAAVLALVALARGRRTTGPGSW